MLSNTIYFPTFCYWVGFVLQRKEEIDGKPNDIVYFGYSGFMTSASVINGSRFWAGIWRKMVKMGR